MLLMGARIGRDGFRELLKMLELLELRSLVLDINEISEGYEFATMAYQALFKMK